ncbi:MAG: hypothetical protein WD336_02720, partial [Trueperaceae bacterium]
MTRRRTARRTSVRRTVLVALPLLLPLWLAGAAVAQDRAGVTIGVAGHPVAGHWSDVVANVRDAPGAVLRLDLDAGGLYRGRVPMTLMRTFPTAGGAQRLAFDLPLPRWRSLTWRIEHDGRTLVSGALPARERDDRPLHLVVGSAATVPSPSPSGDDALQRDPARVVR